jgi:hypothetical protein
MSKHIELAGVLYVLWGGMCVLLSLSLLSIGVAATAIGLGVEGGGGNIAAGLVAAAFFAAAGVGLVFGGAHAWVGGRLRRLGGRARTPAIILAILDLMVVPFGTALGVYTLWALLHEQSRRLFLSPPAAGR